MQVNVALAGRRKTDIDQEKRIARAQAELDSQRVALEREKQKQIAAVRLLADNLEYVRDGKGITIEGLPAYQDLSDQGLIHRDIKPANILLAHPL